MKASSSDRAEISPTQASQAAHGFFPDTNNLPERELFPGVKIRTTWGNRIMISFVRLSPDSEVPPHSHPHEQMGMLLEGDCAFTIGGETRHLKTGDVWCIPGNVTHSVRAGRDGAYALDIFSPPREDYQSGE